MSIDKKDIRPVIDGINNISNKSIEEAFQNKTLRPIIKLQHNLIIEYFKEYLKIKKCFFNKLSKIKQEEFIDKSFKKDNSFKLELKGIVIGHFTVEEFTIYKNNKNDYNKRILTMIQQRISSVITLF